MRSHWPEQIDGLHYCTTVHDSTGIERAMLVFRPSGEPIRECWDYLEEIRRSGTNSYNTLRSIAYDLVRFYDGLKIIGVLPEQLTPSTFARFVEYLIDLDPEPDRRHLRGGVSIPRTMCWSVERSLWSYPPILPAYSQGSNVIALRSGIGLDQDSIRRTVWAIKRYLEWLARYSPYRQRFAGLNLNSLFRPKSRLFRSRGSVPNPLDSRTTPQGYLSAKGIAKPRPNTVEPVSEDRVFSAEEIIAMVGSTRNPRDRFHHFLLFATGLRLGESLGLRIDAQPIRAYGVPAGWRISGDVQFVDGSWRIRVVPRADCPTDCRVKNGKPRDVLIADWARAEFETCLDRYLQWRSSWLARKGSREQGYLLINHRGARLTASAAEAQFRRIKHRAGLDHREDLTVHSYRHTNISDDIIKRGVPVIVKSQDAGHNDPHTTRTMYLHADRRRLAEIQLAAAALPQGGTDVDTSP